MVNSLQQLQHSSISSIVLHRGFSSIAATIVVDVAGSSTISAQKMAVNVDNHELLRFANESATIASGLTIYWW